MRTRGTVTRREGDTAWVKVCHSEHCVGCGLHSPEDEFVEVAVRDPQGAKPGQKVEFDSDAGQMIRTMLLVFWSPIAAPGLLGWGGWALAGALGLPPLLGALTLGAAGLGLAILGIRRVEDRTEEGSGLTIVRVLPSGGCGQADHDEG